MPNKMERFTHRARHVLSLAQEEAEHLQHSHIGTQHLLIGLMREEGGIAARVLRDLGLDIRRVEELVEQMTPEGQRGWTGRLELSPGTKKVLELAVDEARRLGHHYVGTEHLLLGLVRQSEGIAINVLTRLNVRPEEVRRQVRRVLQESSSGNAPPFGTFAGNPVLTVSPTVQPHGMERFTQRARHVLALAQEEAERLQHSYIGTEHLLIGLIREEGGVARHVLEDLGLDQHHITETVERMTRAGQRTTTTRLDLSPGTKKVLELAVDEARRMSHHYIGTEHLLLGLVRQSEGIALDVLKRLNVSPEEVRRQTRRVLQEAPLDWRGPELSLAKFTSVILTLTFAKAKELKHDHIGTEHVLLAMLMDDRSVAGNVLRTLGITADRVQELVQQLPTSQATLPDHLRYSPDLLNALGMAAEEAIGAGNPYLRSEHLLLGLVRQKDSPAIDILKQLNVSPEQVEKAVRDTLK